MGLWSVVRRYRRRVPFLLTPGPGARGLFIDECWVLTIPTLETTPLTAPDRRPDSSPPPKSPPPPLGGNDNNYGLPQLFAAA